MRYLDREPQPGDRVEVPAFEAIYSRRSKPNDYPASYSRRFPHRVRVEGIEGYEAWASEVRVIAPEARVGDVVTADMDLPDGSIIAHPSGGVGVKERGNRIYIAGMATPRPLSDLSDPTGWRIVRIGPAS